MGTNWLVKGILGNTFPIWPGRWPVSEATKLRPKQGAPVVAPAGTVSLDNGCCKQLDTGCTMHWRPADVNYSR